MKKLLDSDLLELLAKEKEDITLDDKKEIFKLVLLYSCNTFGKGMFEITVEDIETDDEFITKSEVILKDKEPSHLITLNSKVIENFSVERLVLAACYESSYVLNNDKLLKESNCLDISKFKRVLDFSNNYDDKDFDFACAVGEDIYEKAAYSTKDRYIKGKHLESYCVLEYYEQVKMNKYQEELSKKEANKNLLSKIKKYIRK